ncbi:hypothetical protein [Aurantimonas sp. E1-2-R+4]
MPLNQLRATGTPLERLVCNYIAGMTDSYRDGLPQSLHTRLRQ